MKENAEKSAKRKALIPAEKRLEDIIDRHAKEIARSFGPVRILGADETSDPRLKIANEVFAKAARRLVN